MAVDPQWSLAERGKKFEFSSITTCRSLEYRTLDVASTSGLDMRASQGLRTTNDNYHFTFFLSKSKEGIFYYVK